MIIISKIELEGLDNLKYTDIGYTTDINVANQINEDYDSTLGKFLGENRTKLTLGEVSISAFFVDVDSVNEARTEVDTVEGLGISEITNVNQL
tara:strand:+ start:1198 stop:1476 length:279 start_codon:yes stop_codon:yes gene_type:complete